MSEDTDLLAAFRMIVDELPGCHHTGCGRLATWRQKTTHLCDEHMAALGGPRRALDGTIVGASLAYEGSEPYWELKYAPGVRQLDRARRA